MAAKLLMLELYIVQASDRRTRYQRQNVNIVLGSLNATAARSITRVDYNIIYINGRRFGYRYKVDGLRFHQPINTILF